jgi:subtilisin family serine protease
MLDSGLWQDPSQNYLFRVLASIDVTNGGSGPVTGDPYGHGTHITSIATGGATNISGNYLGIAPQANLVIVRAFDGKGAGRYIDVISGLDWIVANQKKYNIRGRDGGMEGGHRRGGGRRELRSFPDDHRRTGQRALRDHDRRTHRQLHADQPDRRSPRLVFLGRSDL